MSQQDYTTSRSSRRITGTVPQGDVEAIRQSMSASCVEDFSIGASSTGLLPVTITFVSAQSAAQWCEKLPGFTLDVPTMHNLSAADAKTREAAMSVDRNAGDARVMPSTAQQNGHM